MKTAALALGAALLLAPPTRAEPLPPGTTVADLLAHPALFGFASRILPRPADVARGALPLSRLDRLMPYHSGVRPAEGVAAIDRLIAEAEAGRAVFLEIYSEAERRADPARAAAGVFVFRGPPGAPFALIAPGGGFTYVGVTHEGFPIAEAINAAGFNAFVVTYRTGRGGGAATEDMARALTAILDQAEALQVSPDGFSLWGFSAGARMAAYLGSHGTRAFGASPAPRAAAVVMAYTAHADISGAEPPTYAIVGARDGISPPEAMRRRIARLDANGTPTALRVVPGMPHGFAAGHGSAADGWIAEAVAFWRGHAEDGARRAPRRSP